MTCTLEPAIQSGDTGQWMAFLTAVDVYYQVILSWLHTDCIQLFKGKQQK